MNTLMTLTEAEKQEIVELYKTGEPLKDIATAYHLKDMSSISYLAKQAGAPPRRALVHRKQAEVTPPALTPEAELAQLKKREQELREQIEHRQLAVELVDDTTIEVRGVTAHFLKFGGMAMVREFIIKRFPQSGVEHLKPCPHCGGRGQV